MYLLCWRSEQLAHVRRAPRARLFGVAPSVSSDALSRSRAPPTATIQSVEGDNRIVAGCSAWNSSPDVRTNCPKT